ncbi:MAG: hypothetical protein H0W64_06215 [Gammaproteobacteria bacterium]|nr:hypothetical protein [Gammaproteobacteria bacterium]
MTANRKQLLSSMSTRQKVTVVVFILVLLFLLWQIYALLATPSSPSTPVNKVPAVVMPTLQNSAPQSAPLPRPSVLTPQEAAIQQMQQETESKYLTALNELQMLRIVRDIAETNKAIMSAKLDTLTAEKSIVDLLKPPPVVTPGAYAQTLITPTGGVNSTTATTTPPLNIAPPPPTLQANELPYTVISVSQLQYRWGAVLGLQGNLYSVQVGDVLPMDQSRVVSIDKGGVILEKGALRRRISLVPII